MKKNLLFAFALTFGWGASFAQDTIPNPFFEDWTGALVNEPINWGTANKVNGQLNGCVTKATASNDVYEGSSAVIMTTVKVTYLSDSWPVAGTAVSGGEIAITPPYVRGGIPYTQKPTNLTGYAKYFPKYGIWPSKAPQGTDPETGSAYAYGQGSLTGIAAGDTVGLDISDIRVYLFHWNGTSRDTIATGQCSPTDTVYTKFVAPIYYDSMFSGVSPDSAQIVLASSKGKELAPGSKLYVDSVAFDFTPGVGVEEYGQTPFVLGQNYPNPFRGTTEIKFTSTNSQVIKFAITDMLGRVVYSADIKAVSGENKITFSANLQSGTYFYSISDGEYRSTKKMIISE